MLIALLALLGVNLIVIVALLGVVLSRRLWVKRQPGAFLDESANAPWTRTTLTGGLEACSDMRAPYWALTSMTARANASGASCGRLWPTPPVIVRCEYAPENLPAYEPGSGCGAPLAVAFQRDRR